VHDSHYPLSQVVDFEILLDVAAALLNQVDDSVHWLHRMAFCCYLDRERRSLVVAAAVAASRNLPFCCRQQVDDDLLFVLFSYRGTANIDVITG
jgi:hypothetical protein